jgi:hypothetical protein
MMPLKQMNHLMHQDVFKARIGFLGKLKVDPDAISASITGTPSRPHTLDLAFCDLHSDYRFPFLDQLWESGAESLSIPLMECHLTCLPSRPGRDKHLQDCAFTRRNRSRHVLLDHT